MTKQELLALAQSRKARIDIAYTITRYCVTPGVTQNDLDAEAIFFSISNEDGSIYNDVAYFTDGDDEEALSWEEVVALANLVPGVLPRRC